MGEGRQACYGMERGRCHREEGINVYFIQMQIILKMSKIFPTTKT